MNFIRQFFINEFRLKKLNSPFGYVLLTIASLVLAKIMTHDILGIIAFAGLFGITIVVMSFTNPRMGFIFCFLMSSFIFIIQRVIRTEIPFGIARDALFIVILLGMTIKRMRKREPISWNVKSPITIILLAYSLYLMVQFFNPNGPLSGWAFGIRGFLSYLSAYFILNNLFDDFKFVVLFTKLWLGVAFLAAIYAIYQEYAGLPPYDLRWVTASEQRIGLNFIAGRWRKWSFLSDSAAFGLFMAFSSIFCVVMSLGVKTFKKRVILLASGGLMLVAMAFSGTRTAYAVVPIGLFLYVLLTINKPKTLLFAISAGMFLVVLLFGPYQNGTIVRVRTAFSPSDDPSMLVRDLNRKNIQPYIYSHPMGGGLVTAGEPGKRFAPGHRLAGFPPDSGYLETALEQGWIGLIIQLAIYFTVLTVGIKNYYACRSTLIRNLYASYICGFFALTIAVYAKTGVIQLPLGLILMGIYSLMHKLRTFDEPEKELAQY